MNSKSLWQDTVKLKKWPQLKGVVGCDVLVIGGGMAGTLTAERLNRQGTDVVLVEANRLGSGTTAGTTAKITSQHGLIYQKLAKEMGTEKAGIYLDVNETAIREYERLCCRSDEEDSCGFKKRKNLIYSCRGTEPLEEEMRVLEQLGYPAQFRSDLPLPFETDGAVEFPEQASMHPLKLLKRLTEENCQRGGREMRIFENSRITGLRRWKDGGWEAITEHGSILADQVVVASHFPFVDRRGGFFMKMHQNRSLVIAGMLEEGKVEIMDGMYKDEAEGGLSLREAEGYLLVGGGSGRPGKLKESWSKLEQQAANFWPDWKTVCRWSAQDCMTLDGIPYIGPYYGILQPGEYGHGLWTATGFNKWGMTGSMVSAMILADLVSGRKNVYAELFHPSRTMVIEPLMNHAAESVGSFLKPKVPRCRHMGCALTWNEEEMTWDCPCHGSRYDETGRCIEGPSVKDLF